MRTRQTVSMCLLLIAVLLSAGAFAQGLPEKEMEIQGTVLNAGKEPVQVLVVLNDPPAAVVYADVKSKQGSSEALALSQAKSQVERLRKAQEPMAALIEGAPFYGKEIYRVQKALNGISIMVAPGQIEALKKLPGVKAVHIVEPEYPSLSTSVPFIGAQHVWNGLPGGIGPFKGDTIRIGIIDSGIDYNHADFGGTGLLADYQANDRVNPNAFYPNAKVVGGWDFAGDAYTGGNVPVPDANPTDCLGHGSHVAGIAAGYGVNADGTTYTGPYDDTTNFSSFRIGPGVAPRAQLYSLRVFGCGGSTGLTVLGIEWAMDPNGDNDMSDHLDVINMSLGSQFGSPASTTAMASDNAALVGVIVVASAGNSGDTYFITGSPGVSGRTISTASCIDNGVLAEAQVVQGANTYIAIPGSFPVPPSGQTAGIQYTTPVNGCAALTGFVPGRIALIDRGTCTFVAKAQAAQAAGAIAVIIANNTSGYLTMAGDPSVTIPVVLVSQADGLILKGLATGTPVTINPVWGGDMLSSFSSRGPSRGSMTRLKPDIAAPGDQIISVETGMTCTSAGAGCIFPNATGYNPGNLPGNLSGTSMAAPHMAGAMALLKQQHPGWTVEELKAAAMNGALHNVTTTPSAGSLTYGAGRVGAGRVDPVVSAKNGCVAFNDEPGGLVSVSFDASVTAPTTQTKNVRVMNNGTEYANYDISLVTTLDAPGITFTEPYVSMGLGTNASVLIPVTMTANPAQMKHAREATVSNAQTGPSPLANSYYRHWLTEESAYLVLSQGGQPKIRVPIYMTARPASVMQGPASIVTGGAPTGSTTLALTGTGVCTGTPGVGTCAGTFPNDEVSLVTPFELQVVHPRDPSIPDYLDIQYAGVAYNTANNIVMFGVSTWGPWATPTDVSFSIDIDNNLDGVWDRTLFNSNPGTMAGYLFGTSGAYAQDSFLCAYFNIATSGVGTTQYLNAVSANTADTALFKNSVMFLTASPASLGMAGTSFRYRIIVRQGTSPVFGPAVETISGPFFWDRAAQGLNFGGTYLGNDLNGATIPVTWNTANLATNGSLGALLLHHHNAPGNAAQVIPLQGTASADLAISKTALPATPTFGQNVVFTLTVTNNGGSAASGVTASDPLPAELTFVSDDGAGAYNSATGQWIIGALGSGTSATLHITCTVSGQGTIVNTAKVMATSPLDPVPANNTATAQFSVGRSADLGVTKTGDATVYSGGNITYTINMTNAGPDDALHPRIQDNVPANTTFVSATASAGAVLSMPGVGGTGTVTATWPVNALPAGETFSLTLVVNVPTNVHNGTLISNTATVASLIPDGNAANNTATCVTTVVCPTFSILPAVLPPSVTGLPYSQQLTTVGTAGACTFAVTAGTLPPGITVSVAGLVSGTPTSTLNYNFTVTATDAAGCTSTQAYTFASANLFFLDDAGRTRLCVNARTGAYIYQILLGPHAGETYTGTANIVNGGTKIYSKPGAADYLNFTYDPIRKRAAGYFQSPVGGYSTLADYNTANNAGGCT